jgi:hypothetical protein
MFSYFKNFMCSFLKALVLIFLFSLIRGMLVCIASFVIVLLLHPSLSFTFVMLFYSSSSWFLSLSCIQALTSFHEWSHKLTLEFEQMFTLGFLILFLNSLCLHWSFWQISFDVVIFSLSIFLLVHLVHQRLLLL